jgi:hypothetical protein
MSAIGPKRTSLVATHMSAFGGKADIATYRLDFGPTSRIYPRRFKIELLKLFT